MAAKPGPIWIEELALLGDRERINLLRSRIEDQWFDRKGARVRARELADTMVALANAEGGLIAIGLGNRAVEGVDSDADAQNDWRQAARDHIRPPVRARVELVPCINRSGDPDHLMLIEIGASEQAHENARGEILLRIGDEDRRLGPIEAQELRYEKGGTFFDATAVRGASQEDLDPRLVEAYLRRVGRASRPQEALAARGLLAPVGDGLVPTVAGILTLGRDPQRFYPEAFVRLLRYRGHSQETGARSNVVRDVRVEGSLTAQLARARRLLRGWLESAIRLGRGGRFGAQTVIPEPVWLEAIVNATVHRSYSIGGDHIRVSLFDDRLEVESPGRLPGLVRIETIRETRFARNPRIARVLLELGHGRELGEGVNRMFEDMEAAGLPDPVYRQGSASVRVALLMDPLAARIARLLPLGADRLVETLSADGRVTTAQAAELMGVSVPTVRKYLRRLAEAGFLEREEESPQDPRGYWSLVVAGS